MGSLKAKEEKWKSEGNGQTSYGLTIRGRLSNREKKDNVRSKSRGKKSLR